MIISELQLDVKKVYPDLENLEVTPTTNQQIFNHQNSYGYDNVVVNAVDNTIDENITPNNIRTGVRILGVDGNLEPDKPNQEKEVTPTKQEQNIFADTGYELGKVVVKPIPSEYVVPIGSVDIVENGVYDVTSVAEATVNTPVPFGTKEITENGTYDVTNYESANVNVPIPTLGTKTIIENGTYNASDDNLGGYSSLEVNVPSTLENITKLSTSDSSYNAIYNMLDNQPLVSEFDTTIVAIPTRSDGTPLLDTSGVINGGYYFRNCSNLKIIPKIDTSNLEKANYMFNGCTNLTTIAELDFGNVYTVENMLYNTNTIVNMGGFKDLGKSYDKLSGDKYRNLFTGAVASHESLVNIINKVYNLNNNSSAKTSTIKVYVKNSAYNELTEEEIAIATAKGWSVSKAWS